MGNKSLRVLQVIDSLEPGGSEKMAVQLANVLSTHLELSALVCTRQSGHLEKEISAQVVFDSLYKRNSFDLKAFLRLRTFVKSNRIHIVHAHSTSVYWGTLLKFFCPKIKLIWHDHYGMSDALENRKYYLIKFTSYYFDDLIAVNKTLKAWAKKNLNCRSVHYSPNFSLQDTEKTSASNLILKGQSDDFKIIHVANLRPQKDHLNALRAINLLLNQNLKISYHIVGHYETESSYYKSVKSYIEDHELSENVFMYGSQTGVFKLLQQADLGLLSSLSEGLPVSLLEYAKAELPVVITDVGQCKSLVGEFGKVVPPQDEYALAEAIQLTITDPKLSKINALKLKQEMSQSYDSNKIIEKLIEIYTLSFKN